VRWTAHQGAGDIDRLIATSLLAREAFATLGITASMGALQLQRSERRCGETRSTSCSLRTKYEATLKKRREELLRQMRGKRKTRRQRAQSALGERVGSALAWCTARRALGVAPDLNEWPKPALSTCCRARR